MEERKKLLSKVNFGLQLTHLLVGYLGLSVIAAIVASILSLFSNTFPLETLDAIHLFLSYLLTAGIMLYIPVLFKPFYDYLKLCLKDKKGIIEGIIIAVLMFTVSYIYSLIIQWTVGNVGANDNQEGLQTTFEAMPLLSFFTICILAPICEELTYRYGLFGLISRKSKKLAWIVTILFFALIHFNFDTIITFIQTKSFDALFVEIINLPAYLIGAAFLTYAYSREENIVTSITAHAIYNFSQYVLMLITTFLL